VYYADHSVFGWLRGRTPRRFRLSIFLYDLTADAEGRARLAPFIPKRSGEVKLAVLAARCGPSVCAC